MTEHTATVPDWTPVMFTQQRDQFPRTGPAGMSYEQHTFPDRGPDALVHCLLWRDDDGSLVGILYYYPNDVPPYERAGNTTVVVDPRRRREGIATRLLTEADRLWLIDFDTQDYTPAGATLATSYERRRGTSLDKRRTAHGTDRSE